MNKILIVILGVVAGTAAWSADDPAKAAEKARNERFAALVKAGDALVKKDFQGPFANYWHTNIDQARASYEAALKEDYTVGQKVDLCCRIASCKLEATRDVDGAMKTLDEAIALAGDDAAAKQKAVSKKAAIEAMLDGSAFAPKPKGPRHRVNPQPLVDANELLLLTDAKGDAEKIIRAFATTNLVVYAEKLSKAAKWLLKGGDETAARRVWAKREAIVPTPAQPVLDMAYWADAPHDIRGIVESERYRKAEKGYLNRRYGNNLKFLIETDSALLGRQMTTDDGKSFRPTEIFAFWDSFGVKILVRSFVDDPVAMKDGLLDPGGYEAYLATGIDDPYHCVMIDAHENGCHDDTFVTQYDNGTGFRRFSAKDRTLRVDTLYLEDGAAALLSVPWSAAFAAVPWKREAWFFEAIHWAHGGLSWGGSTSVHYRSMFGKLRFTGGDEASYAAVKRQLIFAAKAKLQNVQSPRQNGCVERWMDPELGDQEFYLARVKPLVTRLSAALGAVNAKTDAAGVCKVYDEAVDETLNIEYLVSRLRTEWVEEKETR